MDGVEIGCSAKTADPSTALRSGRDDKGRAVTLQKASDSDGQNQERLSRILDSIPAVGRKRWAKPFDRPSYPWV
jgi:hypothetical protein